MTPSEAKQRIIGMFEANVKGRRSDTTGINPRHRGKDGHWLEAQMGIQRNGKNAPDLLGYEMKNHTTSGKTTFGDWSADYYIFRSVNGQNPLMDRHTFLTIFGKPNIQKRNRYSWSGDPAPKISNYNAFGQMLSVDADANILALYSYSQDTREGKSQLIPNHLQHDEVILAKWNKETIQVKLERKFNNLGWFKCLKDTNGIYDEIVFGAPINYVTWIEQVRRGVIFFDSGMYDGNNRPYSTWRANNDFWESLIIDRIR